MDSYHETHSAFHLREGFYFDREGDEIILTGGEASIRVSLSEWASAVAHTTVAGDNQQTWEAVLDLLGAEPVVGETAREDWSKA